MFFGNYHPGDLVDFEDYDSGGQKLALVISNNDDCVAHLMILVDSKIEYTNHSYVRLLSY